MKRSRPTSASPSIVVSAPFRKKWGPHTWRSGGALCASDQDIDTYGHLSQHFRSKMIDVALCISCHSFCSPKAQERRVPQPHRGVPRGPHASYVPASKASLAVRGGGVAVIRFVFQLSSSGMRAPCKPPPEFSGVLPAKRLPGGGAGAPEGGPAGAGAAAAARRPALRRHPAPPAALPDRQRW